MQSKMGSFVEAWLNVAIGFSINFVMNLVILPAVGLPIPSVAQNMGLGVLFTVVSVSRSYAVRRYFNGRITRFANQLAERME